MNIWDIDKTLLFLVLVLPGFISIKVYRLIVATEYKDFSKSLIETICYSVLNFSLLSWLIILISKDNFVDNHPIVHWISIFLIFIIFPAIWPFCYIKVSELKIFKKNLLSPYKQPWDYVFNKRNSMWVVIHLKDGKTLRGKYATNSFASSFPAERQIYLEELWLPSEKGGFKRKIARTQGVIVSQDEISRIEFYGKKEAKYESK